ncbi:hypothetical protein PENSUB_7181 [Penicillium subrubescens]|uniref:Major facilitator superfamily (MFS) profile domain-containing protein n=1 Tax=Penicillium subrubescens TaxID=1316194 RepID=A0A1Q5TPQ2_9EURO|nr:hypothetical protein PENSUB_7181 [Penicillium subrubescens]
MEQRNITENPDMDKVSVAHVLDVSHVLKAEVGRERLSDRLPPHESYEGRHRWDPALTWTADEERKLVRKTDFYLLSCLCVMFFGLQLDRGNLSNALADDLLKDLKLTSDDYNNAWITNRASFYITRALIGLFEGGFIPGTMNTR